jgi:negative regulator of sigma E activity
MTEAIRPLRRLLGAALVGGLFAVLGVERLPAANAADGNRGDTLVRMAFEAPRHVSYVGQLQVTRWSGSRSIAQLTRIEHRAPGDTRRTMLAPPSMYGDYEIQHGDDSWTFDVKRSRIVRTRNRSASNDLARDSNIALLVKNYRAVLGPTEPIAGRQASTVSLVNRYTGERTMRIWIDSSTNLLLAKDVYRTDGSLESRVRFDEIRFTDHIPSAIFAANSPQGFASVEGRTYGETTAKVAHVVSDATFKVVTPKELPEGFAILSADTSTANGLKSVHLLYTDGVRNLSLFENDSNRDADFGSLAPTTVRLENHDAHYVKDGPTTLLAWREHGLAFALVGDIGIKDMLQIAASVIP